MSETNTAAPGFKGIDLRTIQTINEKNDQAILTDGEKIMNVWFNPSKRKDVFGIKLWCAMMFDWLNLECSKTQDDLERYNRKQRLKAVALTHLETFQMNAVKAVTFTNEFLAENRSTMSFPEPTDGQLIMTVSFNETKREDVNFIKRCCALTYDDLIEEVLLRKDDFKKQADDFERNYKNEPLTSWPEEIILAQRKLEFSCQAMEESLYSLRQFQLFAVKAITR